MKVFISWSGKRSKAVGTLLDEWLRCVLQAIEPWMSYKDIDRGSLWFSEINNQLCDTEIGIVCLTGSNLNKPWILFEAGALAKGLSTNRVCTFLIDLEDKNIKDPLAQFNHTLPNKDGVWNLVCTLNNSLKDNKLSEKTLERVFDTYWPQFEESFQNILKETKDDEVILKREEPDILNELLTLSRNLDKRIRKIEYTTENKMINKDTSEIKREYIMYPNLYSDDNSIVELKSTNNERDEKYFSRILKEEDKKVTQKNKLKNEY